MSITSPSCSACLVGHHDASFGQQILDIPEAEAKPVVEPDCVTDDFVWETVSVIAGSGAFHPINVAGIGSS